MIKLKLSKVSIRNFKRLEKTIFVLLLQAVWGKIKRVLEAEFKDSALEHLQGIVSAPFVEGVQGQIAIKAIDQRGNELLVIKKFEDLDK